MNICSFLHDVGTQRTEHAVVENCTALATTKMTFFLTH